MLASTCCTGMRGGSSQTSVGQWQPRKGRDSLAQRGSAGCTTSDRRVSERRHMAHSYSSNLLHVTFSTKERKPLIVEKVQERLWAYFVGIGRNHSIPILAVGGIANHVHLLFSLPQTVSLAKAIQIFKANSSRWMRERVGLFAWQEGYGAFSVSPSQAGRVKEYIRNQPAHQKF